MMKRSLYMCSNAKVKGVIKCREGHPLSRFKDGNLPIINLARGEPLELTICQDCLDYDEMGEPVEKEDRGWINGGKRRGRPRKETNYEIC